MIFCEESDPKVTSIYVVFNYIKIKRLFWATHIVKWRREQVSCRQDVSFFNENAL